jgi:nucleoid DNA-binding protein
MIRRRLCQFGWFRVRQRKARRRRNPKTGAPVDFPAKRVLYIKPGKELKELIGDRSAEEDREHAVNTAAVDQ